MDFIQKYIDTTILLTLRDVIITLVVGYLIIQSLVLITRRLLWKHLTRQWKMLISKGIVYSGVIITLLIILDIFHIRISAILGAAGVLGVVIGFASQTSIGNIISGLFLVTEKPFEVGDLIKVGDKTGNVYSIDLLSIKLRTLDNLLIRIPNQTILSTEVTNVTRFPIRRMDITIGISYKNNPGRVLEILKQIAKDNPDILNEPEPLTVISEFADSSINLIYGIWFEKSNYLKVRNSVMQNILDSFALEGIEIPYPHRAILVEESKKNIIK